MSKFSLLDLPPDLGEATWSMRSSGREVCRGGAVGGEHGYGSFFFGVGFEQVVEDGGEGDEGPVSTKTKSEVSDFLKGLKVERTSGLTESWESKPEPSKKCPSSLQDQASQPRSRGRSFSKKKRQPLVQTLRGNFSNSPNSSKNSLNSSDDPSSDILPILDLLGELLAIERERRGQHRILKFEKGDRGFEEGFDDAGDPEVAHRLRKDEKKRGDGDGDVASGR